MLGRPGWSCFSCPGNNARFAHRMSPDADRPNGTKEVAERTQALRHLYARRLTRLGRWREARPYFPAALRPKLDAYVQGIRDGHDLKKDAIQRGRALFAAATIARDDGMELLGSELGPDDAQYKGAFPHGDDGARTPANDPLFKPNEDMQQRLSESLVRPRKRFHYRYIASDHAWDAAQLLPNESDETATLLCTAGGWLKNQDPKAANRFYKALVTRCGSTVLGKEAERLKWFPK